MDDMKIGKHEKIVLSEIPDSIPAGCFHGEVWISCPHCRVGIEIFGRKPLREKEGYRIYQCDCCRKLVKDYIGMA